MSATKTNNSIFANFLKLLTGDEDALQNVKKRFAGVPTRSELIQRESEIGGRMFGEIPTGHHRLFYNLDQKTWIFYEEGKDSDTTKKATTRYEIHQNGVLKIQEGTPYYYITGQELENFVAATRLYYAQVTRNVYHRDPATGQLLAA